jgi:hypothetical protein
MSFWQRIKNISLADICIFGGLLLLGTGLWWYAPWVSLTVVGGLFFLLGVAASIKAATGIEN